MLCKPEGLISESIPVMPFARGCLLVYIRIVSSTKLNKFWCPLFDLNDRHEGTQVLGYCKWGPLDTSSQIVKTE